MTASVQTVDAKQRSDAGIPHSALRVPHSSLLAWAGWQLSMPREWQPMKLRGMPEKGEMIVGDASCAIFIVKWQRTKKARVSDGRAWVEGRLKKAGVRGDANPPAAEHFTASGWVRGLQTEEGKETTYWYGYSKPAELLLGVTVNGVLPAEIRRTVERDVLSSLRTTALGAESAWAMYDVIFRAPAGFELLQKHLFSGDIALEFGRGKQETLLLRQVYPGELALKRRRFESWLGHYPFKEHRKLRENTVRERPWQHGTRRALNGIDRHAWKRLPVPLGWCSPRRTHALAVHDQKLDRVLLAVHMHRAEPDAQICFEAIERMNAA